MNESWIRNALKSPLQKPAKFDSILDATSSSLDHLFNQKFTPLNIPPPPENDRREPGRTPLGLRRVPRDNGRNRKRLSALLEGSTMNNQNETGTSSSNTSWSSPSPAVPSPKTPRLAVKVLRKITYEDRPTVYLIKWKSPKGNVKRPEPEKDEADGEEKENDPTMSWEPADQLTPLCEKMVNKFEQSITKDPKKAWEYTDYEVEAILDRTVVGKLRYLVKWVGWKIPTWDREELLLPDYADAIKQFNAINESDQSFDEGRKKKRGRPKKGDNDEKGAAERRRESDSSTDSATPLSQAIADRCSAPAGPGWAFTTAKAAKVVKAERVLNKVDKGPKSMPQYLLQWPEEAGVRSAGEKPNESWEHRISLGTRDAIEEFEDALARRKDWAQQLVLFEVEKILKRRKPSPDEAPEYLVKWAGYEEGSWSDMASLKPSYEHLMHKFALEKCREETARRMKSLKLDTVREQLRQGERKMTKRTREQFRALKNPFP